MSANRIRIRRARTAAQPEELRPSIKQATRDRPFIAWPSRRDLALTAVIFALLATRSDWAPALVRLFS